MAERDDAVHVVVGRGSEHSGVDWMLGAPRPEGEIQIVFDTIEPAKNLVKVCVVILDGQHRHPEFEYPGFGLDNRFGDPLVV